jgi:hypothetical protein
VSRERGGDPGTATGRLAARIGFVQEQALQIQRLVAQDSLNLRWSNKPGRFCLGATAPKLFWIPALPKR